MKIKAHELRTKNESELLKTLEELKNELAQLRVATTPRSIAGYRYSNEQARGRG